MYPPPPHPPTPQMKEYEYLLLNIRTQTIIGSQTYIPRTLSDYTETWITIFNTASSAALRFHCVGGRRDRPRTGANSALAVRRSNHSIRSHPCSDRSHPSTRLDLIPSTQLDLIPLTQLDLIPSTRLDLIPSTRLDLIHSTRLDLIPSTRLDLIHSTRLDLILKPLLV